MSGVARHSPLGPKIVTQEEKEYHPKLRQASLPPLYTSEGKMTPKALAFKIAGILVLLWGLYMVVADGKYLTPWFALVWCVIGSLAILQIKVENGKLRPGLPPIIQLLLAALLIIAAVMATRWSTFGHREMNQWGYTIFTLPAYGKGFAWAWSSLKSALDHHRVTLGGP